MKNYKDIYKYHQEQLSVSNSKKKIAAPANATSKTKSPLSTLIYKQINLNLENLSHSKPKLHSMMQNNQNQSNVSHYQAPYRQGHSHKNSVNETNIMSKITKRP